ncbi:hypothetical protein [Salipaludibacillus daqingensis]|uniref:hypothetical protein n=1 Tax=Salipaludibacillus daqingensis TaxID=3041001 RepID=UPI002475808C|nr:hypothetical protein [Salipaludibacillus daqingensis]
MSIYRNVLISVLLLVLFGWALTSFYYASVDISKYFNDSSRSVMFELNILPLIILIFVGSIVSIISFSKKKNKLWSKSLLLPDEFEESDEREKEITSRATRRAYVSMMYATPIIASLLLFYPFISETIPYYPIIIFFLLPLTQVVTYMVSWNVQYNK